MYTKHIVRGIILCGLLGSFGYYLTFSKKGILAYFERKQEVLIEKKVVEKLKAEIAKLQHDTHKWETDSYAREKLAREDLQMSYTNEYVYLLRA